MNSMKQILSTFKELPSLDEDEEHTELPELSCLDILPQLEDDTTD